ncbi:MAG: carboxypeptidase-like regulatory domain-containing protein [Gemmatimonadales bacterium]
MSRRGSIVLAAAMLAAVAKAGAQALIAAPGGVLAGLVRDSISGSPVGYALVVLDGGNQRVFASEAGRFSLSGLASGPVTLRVQQIGYQGVALRLVLDTQAAAPAALTVSLVRQPFVLPDVIVSDGCPNAELGAGESGTILDEAFKNAERLLTLQQNYPYRSSMEQVTVILDANNIALTRQVDTIRIDSKTTSSYQKGKVLRYVRSLEWGRPILREHAVYFQPADLAGNEFRRHHCFWYAGPDSVEGFPGYRIDFRPVASVRTPDWAGSLIIDSAAMHILRSDARLVNLPRNGTAFRSAECTVTYVQFAPTLVHEYRATCNTTHNSRPPTSSVRYWRLLEHAFLERRPQGPDQPPPRQP